jgi:drug/metabolite transporter (DMT)-like permease
VVGAVLWWGAAAARPPAGRPSRGVLGWSAAAGVLGAAGTLAFTLATVSTDLGIASVLTSLYPVVTVLLAAGILGERVGIGQRAGIGICTLAVAVMALG